MSEEEANPHIETITLHTGGPVAGLPGIHSPGTYLVNWLERTITPVVEAIEMDVKKMAGESHAESVDDAPIEAAPASQQSN